MDYLIPIIIIISIYCFIKYKGKSKSYSDLLRDRRWIYKRRKILKRDNWHCTKCSANCGLEIHHKLYYKYPNGEYIEPWKYRDEDLITLCRNCHEELHKNHTSKVYYINKLWKRK